MGIDNIEARDYEDEDDEKEESTRTGHPFVKQSLEGTYHPHHDPEFLDRDYETNSEVGDYTEEDDFDYESMEEGNLEDLERRDNESMGINNIETGDYIDEDKEKEESTSTGHSLVQQSHHSEATDYPHQDPEFLDRDYENDTEVLNYADEEEEQTITKQPHTYSNIHDTTTQKLSLDPEFVDKEYDLFVFGVQTGQETEDHALPISTG